MSLGYMIELDQICDLSWFCSVYAFDLRFYVQMNLVLLKYYLTMLFEKKEKKREMKRWDAKEA